MRISDVLQISPKQVKKVKNELVIDFRQQKTGDRLVTPFETLCDKICPQFKQTLIDYLDFANENKQKTLFPYTCQANLNRIIKKVAKLAGIEKNLSFHTSRHTCAMLLLNEGFLKGKYTDTIDVFKDAYALLKDETFDENAMSQLSKLFQIFFVAQLGGISTLNAVLKTLELKSNSKQKQYIKLCNKLTNSHLHQIFDYVLEHILEQKLTELLQKHASELCRTYTYSNLFRFCAKSTCSQNTQDSGTSETYSCVQLSFLTN